MLPLIFLLLTTVLSSKAEVNSCLQCVSSKEEPLPACEQGSLDQAKPCEEGRQDGCQVQVESDLSSNVAIVWHRDCCGSTTGGCSSTHEAGKDRISCKSENCNTMDPRSGAPSFASLFSTFVLTFALLII